MDELDKRIVNILQKEGRLSIKNISERLFITPPAVSQRLHSLEKNGSILNYQAHLNFPQADLSIKAYIQLSLEPQQKEVFYPYIASVPNVLECDCVTGAYSMMIKVVFESTQALDGFINELQRFGRTNTQIVFSTPVQSRGFAFNEVSE